MRPTWVEVSLRNLRQNFRQIQAHVGMAVAVCAVVKADAYGHGAIECARVLEQEGATSFGVTSTEEGVLLREAGIRGRILLMTGFWRGEEEEIVARQLTPAVWEPWHIQKLQKVARLRGRPAFPIHLKVDTGMRRLGLGPQDLTRFLQDLKSASNLKLEGIFTHLASAEVLDAPDVIKQISRFEQAQRQVKRMGFSPSYRHMANTAAIACRPSTWKNMVRPGIALYGYALPFTTVAGDIPADMKKLPIVPVLSWKTRIISLRSVAANEPIGYGGAYVTRGPSILATVPVGYGDGLDRRLSSRGQVLIRDTDAPMIGNVCMDITLLDVTHVPGVAVGDEITLIGGNGKRSITANESAGSQGTISYEVLCSIGKRVPRQYID